MSWDPSQYLNFKDHRLRPALDLMAQIPCTNPQTVVDLGCGPGNVTALIAGKWPQARVTGIDSSAEMLSKARADHPGIQWRQADIGRWQADEDVNLIFSNACLHWLPDHENLFPRLMAGLAPGGVLAVQMPRNFGRPTHMLVEQAARDTGLFEKLAPLFHPAPTGDPSFYYRILRDHCGGLQIWETDYLQVLEGDNPVAEWTKGSWLRPFLDALEEPDKSRLENRYRKHILDAYPRQGDGKTLLPFLRLFIVAIR